MGKGGRSTSKNTLIVHLPPLPIRKIKSFQVTFYNIVFYSVNVFRFKYPLKQSGTIPPNQGNNWKTFCIFVLFKGLLIIIVNMVNYINVCAQI